MKLILATGAEITFQNDHGIGDIVAEFPTIEAAHAAIELITPEALAHVSTTTDDGQILGEWDDLVLQSAETVPTGSGVEAHIRLREKTAAEILIHRVEALEASQEIQDEAIDDLGAAVSEIVEPGDEEEAEE